MQWQIQLRDGWGQEPRDSIGPFLTQGDAFSESRRRNVDLCGVPNPKVWPRWVFAQRQEEAESVPPPDQHKTIEVPKVAPPNPSAYSRDDDDDEINEEEGLAVKTETFSFHEEEE